MAVDEDIGTTVVNIEEQFRGWFAAVSRERQLRRQIHPYREIARLLDFFQPFNIALLDERAVALVETYGAIRVGMMDKKVAAIAIANNALLLTANRQDFEQIPNLRFANWMDEPTATRSTPP